MHLPPPILSSLQKCCGKNSSSKRNRSRDTLVADKINCYTAEREMVMDQEKLHSGNRFFAHRYESIRISDSIETMNSFEEFERFYSTDLMDENLLLGKYLSHLLEEHEFTPSKASRAIGKDESYVRKITNGEVINPSRDVLLALCVLMGATVEETQILLRYSGKQPLYARRKRDAIIWFALKRRQSRENIDPQRYLEDLNEYLENNDYEGLSKIIIKGERKSKKK